MRLTLAMTVFLATLCNLPAGAQDPRTFAFEWVVPYAPGQMAADPAGNLWILEADTDYAAHRSERDGTPLPSAGTGRDVACTGDGSGALLGRVGYEIGYSIYHADGVVVRCVRYRPSSHAGHRWQQPHV